MNETTTYPGIYVSESASPAVSVTRLSSSVPLFCMGDDFSNEPVRFDNWFDVVNYHGGNVKTGDQKTWALRGYFECGGGPCYAINFRHLLEGVKTLQGRISLVVATANDLTSNIQSILDVDSTLFIILDGPYEEITAAGFDAGYAATSHAAMYYPYLRASWTTSDIPASALVAGLYCRNDATRGVWKSPSNLPLPRGYTPKFKVSDDIQGLYNQGKAINMIRSFGDETPVVWGARTLDDTDAWRYVAVRRLFSSVERDLGSAMEQMLFEPNTPLTWEKVRSAAVSYLHGLWKQGALAGTSEDEAYFVQIGKEVTMLDADIAQGKMIMKVGLAAVRPAEFILLQFTQSMPGS
ncbi:phage tail sheath C-terminal domain-containing protein [Caballeronia sp. LZ034LL]|uniref:phage tail sheath family protein n=1 Tax=Caballeronia sp. LZ034LL TaxID=3038567 RepID=UPI0028608BCC|nr:phage tail sheath C-terminal domain-containing protein [Caballeronia sp. LZ034LL]MDR5837914.1 phage tail sheath C-terminal domain-containing protein [Caballeronia sp. LZ034LL]